MRGPNYWSELRKKLIVAKIEVKETDDQKSAGLIAIGEKLESLQPALHNLAPYGSILNVVTQVAVEIQCRAGMDCVYHQIHPTANPEHFILCFSYTIEKAGIYAAKAAVNLVNALLADQKYQIEKDIQHLIRIRESHNHDSENAKPIPNFPIVAVTGTNGKTTTTRLIAYLVKFAGYSVGFTTTDGIYINDQLISIGDCSGSVSAAVVLNDPRVNFAVLECARGGILRAGLGFDECNVSIVTNISGDHLGMDDIETMEQLSRVKLTVPKATAKDGYAILNADDDLVYRMRKFLSCKIALFSRHPENKRIIKHCNKGGLAAITENGFFTICKGREKFRIAAIANVPLCHHGKSTCMMENVLPGMLTAFIYQLSVDDLEIALKKFHPSPENTPGRMNVFEFPEFTLMVDYAHNEGGYRELKNYTDQLEVTSKVGIIAAVADRPDADIVNMGRLAATIFDEIIIRHDADNSGRTHEELNELLLVGIREINPLLPVKVISNEFNAIKYAITHAKKGDWIFVNAENVYDTLFYINQYKPRALSRPTPQHLQRRGVF